MLLAQYESQQDLSRTDGMGEPTFHSFHTQTNMELIFEKPRQSMSQDRDWTKDMAMWNWRWTQPWGTLSKMCEGPKFELLTLLNRIMLMAIIIWVFVDTVMKAMR